MSSRTRSGVELRTSIGYLLVRPLSSLEKSLWVETDRACAM